MADYLLTIWLQLHISLSQSVAAGNTDTVTIGHPIRNGIHCFTNFLKTIKCHAILLLCKANSKQGFMVTSSHELLTGFLSEF